MKKKVLIISPYFAPTNAADIHRVRMSLPYFADYGWDASIVAVDPKYSDLSVDPLLTNSIPKNTDIYYVKALDKKLTSTFGLGSIALRSYSQYQNEVELLLKKVKFDLIYFSTTQFAVCALGARWKKKFNVPYVIDVQDPWFTSGYARQKLGRFGFKHWVAAQLNKHFEAVAMKSVDGLIAVSEKYIEALKSEYNNVKSIPATVIPFGAYEADLQIALQNSNLFPGVFEKDDFNIVYVGRGGNDMHKALMPFFAGIKKMLTLNPEKYKRLKVYFIGTSYAPAGTGVETFMPLAKRYQLENIVVEITDRVGYYHALALLQNASVLFIPGSDDPQYSASKIYPYLLTRKPLLAIFNEQSPALAIFKEYGAENIFSYHDPETEKKVISFFERLFKGDEKVTYIEQAFERYAAMNLTNKQCRLFDRVLIKIT